MRRIFLLATMTILVTGAARAAARPEITVEAGGGAARSNNLDFNSVFGTIRLDVKNASTYHVASYARWCPWAAVGLEYLHAGSFDPKSLTFPDLDGDGRSETFDVGSSHAEFNVETYDLVARLGKTLTAGAVGIRPYLSVGAGMYVLEQVGGEAALSGQSSTGIPASGTVNLKSNAARFLGASLGAGVEFPFRRFVVGADLRFHRVFASGEDRRIFIPSVKAGVTF